MYFICNILWNVCKETKYAAVPDPDLEITGGGGGWQSRPLDRGRGGGLQKTFSASVWSKNKVEGGGGQAPWAPLLDPPLCCYK